MVNSCGDESPELFISINRVCAAIRDGMNNAVVHRIFTPLEKEFLLLLLVMPRIRYVSSDFLPRAYNILIRILVRMRIVQKCLVENRSQYVWTYIIFTQGKGIIDISNRSVRFESEFIAVNGDDLI